MRELLQSFLRMSWSMSLLGLKQLIGVFSGENLRLGSLLSSTGAMFPPVIVPAFQNQEDDSESAHSGWTPMQSAGPTISRQQDGPAATQSSQEKQSGWDPMPSSPAAASSSPPDKNPDPADEPMSPTSGWSPMPSLAPPVAAMIAAIVSAPATVEISSGTLDTTRFVVVGEGLAAGMGNFTLSVETQTWSFPTQMAKQMKVACPQRLLQAPGVGNTVGFPRLPVRISAPQQTTVVSKLPPDPVSNLAVPEFTLDDALNTKASQPLVHRNDAKRTALNLIFGLEAMSGGEALPTQLEYALRQSPTFVIVELGYYEVLQAAVLGDPDLLPRTKDFVSQFTKLLDQFKGARSQILVMTIPDPLDTAHFSKLSTAARLLKVEPAVLTKLYGVAADDLLTVNGLNEIGYQFFAKSIGPLPEKSILPSATATQISNRVREINENLTNLAAKYGSVFDLAGLFQRIANQGYLAGTRVLTGAFLGGFYSLNGYYPGSTGQAIIANEVLGLLNRSYGSNFPMIDISSVMATDSVASYHEAGGPAWTSKDMEGLLSKPLAAPPAPVDKRNEDSGSATSGWAPLVPEETKLPLVLPPGLEQVLPLSKAASHFGDGISPIDCHDPNSVQWGSCGNFLFGGLAMVDSHLNGSLRFKFTPPVNDVTHFEVSFEGGFAGEDAVLVTPQLFKMGFQQTRVDQVPGTISSGTLNLATGEVSDLSIYARYSATALLALVSINPTFPRQPLNFPGQYGYAWAKFEQRADGKLDFSFHGSTFVPLGKDILWPLNFVGPSGQFATIPAAGTVMHPHLQLSTKEPPKDGADISSIIPFNSVQEFTLYTHNSAFGDAFTLNVPELGGPAKGRSHLMGRLQIQFGNRTGDSVPIAVWAVPPGGQLAPVAESPITQIFPTRLSGGPQGFNENLRFPLRTYPLDVLAIIGDPFDLSVGLIDLRTGRLLNELLHRGFINQDVIYALLRVEPRTPQGSFYFKGPALITKDSRNQMVFRFRGITHLPYPEGFGFPRPDFATAFIVGSNSALDPFLWFHAIQSKHDSATLKEGDVRSIRASSGEEFSFRYSIPADPTKQPAMFEYENLTQQGRFSLRSLSWVDFSNSGTSVSGGEDFDTVTFSGFGIWSKNGTDTLQQAAVQISTSQEKPYVGIQISTGDVSNVNTKPQNEPDALP